MLQTLTRPRLLHLGRGNKEFKFTMGGVEEEKDVGVKIHHTLRPTLLCAKASTRAKQVRAQLATGTGPPSSRWSMPWCPGAIGQRATGNAWRRCNGEQLAW